MLEHIGSTDQLPLEWGTVVYEIGTSSVFVLLYLFILFLLLDLGRLVHLVPRTLLYHNGWMAAGIAVFMFVLFLYGNLHYKDKYREELTFESSKITRPVRLVMMSDLHLGYHNPRELAPMDRHHQCRASRLGADSRRHHRRLHPPAEG